MRLLPGIRRGSGGARRARLTACDPTYEPNARVSSWVPMFMLIWFSPSSFIYETPYGGAEKSPAGRSVVYKIEDCSMRLKGTYPKGVNAQDARIKFRRRRPRLGGADEALLGVGGMGDDIWRELVERDNRDDVDEAWSAFRKQLELGREIEVVDENGDRIEYGDYPDEEEPEYD